MTCPLIQSGQELEHDVTVQYKTPSSRGAAGKSLNPEIPAPTCGGGMRKVLLELKPVHLLQMWRHWRP